MPTGVLLTVAYDGRNFAGSSPQPEQRTVVSVLREAIHGMDPAVERLRAVSRTDSGVHARAQQVSFDTVRVIPPRGWVLGLNARLPSDVAVRGCRHVPLGFDPRDWSRGKRYRYRVRVDEVRDPLRDEHSWRVDPPVDLALLEAEAQGLVGTYDFRAFRTASDPRTDTIRTLTRVSAETTEPYVVRPSRGWAFEIVVEGTAFLHNMVRIIAGTLVDVARGRLAPGAVQRGLATGQRTDLGMTAPAQGLVLDEVFFDPNAFEGGLVAASAMGDLAWP